MATNDGIKDGSFHDRRERTVPVRASRRELRLRERLESIDEEIVRDEKRAKSVGEARRQNLQRKVAKARKRQNEILNRRESSRVYHKFPALYYLLSPCFAIGRFFLGIYRKLRCRVEHHKQVTPHRSFYLTTRGQSIRRIKISGYFRFQYEVGQLIWDNKKIFTKYVLLLFVALVIVTGLSSQESYVAVRDALNEAGLANWAKVPALFVQGFLDVTSVTDTAKQPLFVLLVVFAWLVAIFIMRNIYNGDRIKLRDAIYGAGAPIVSIFTIIAVIIVQILPLALALAVYSSLSNSGLINQGIKIENMAAWVALALFAVLTLYWMITGVLCMITVTLPGIYPMRAYFETSKLVSGRRVAILCRIIAMLVTAFLAWVIVLLPVILLDVKFQFKTVPLVLCIAVFLFSLTIVWVSAYMYVLYRRILDSPLQPIGKSNKKKIVWPWLKHHHVKNGHDSFGTGKGKKANIHSSTEIKRENA